VDRQKKIRKKKYRTKIKF